MKTAYFAKGFFPTRRISFATDDTSLYYICHTSHITTLRGMCAVFASCPYSGLLTGRILRPKLRLLPSISTLYELKHITHATYGPSEGSMRDQ